MHTSIYLGVMGCQTLISQGIKNNNNNNINKNPDTDYHFQKKGHFQTKMRKNIISGWRTTLEVKQI